MWRLELTQSVNFRSSIPHIPVTTLRKLARAKDEVSKVCASTFPNNANQSSLAASETSRCHDDF